MRRLAKEGLLGRGGSLVPEQRGLVSSSQRGRGNGPCRARSEVMAQAGHPPCWHLVVGTWYLGMLL